jgi:gag-polypeptide of LTR copia-type/Zinc knuckle
MSSNLDNGSSTRPPLFDKNDFSGWKGRMSLFLESIDPNMPDILRDGPYVPTNTVVTEAIVREGQPTIPAQVKIVTKEKEDWEDNDRRMVSLDVKARNFIVQAVPKDIFHSIKLCTSAKNMWETLTVMFEGSSTSMESTITTLTRKYERFFALRNESLTDTHTRFNALVNDLISVGIVKTSHVLKSKFLDSLPPKWNNYVSTVKLSGIYKELDLPGLYGLLHNHECSEAEKMIAMGESFGQSSSALVASMTDHPSPKCQDQVPVVLADYNVDQEKSLYSESDAGESEDSDDLAREVALLAERFKKKSFRKFKGKGRSAQADKSKKPLDMTKVTCYKCGKTGHMANDCRSKNSVKSDYTKGEKNDKYTKLKAKFKALQAQVAKLSESSKLSDKSLVAKDWAESDTSSDDEQYEDAKCFMARETAEKFMEDVSKIQQKNLSAQSSSTSSSSSEVNPFLLLSDNEKLAKVNRLGDEVLLQKHYNKAFKDEISALKVVIGSKNNTIDKLQSEIKALKSLNSTLIVEAKESEEKYLKIKHITESWCTSAKRTAKCVNVQVPGQIQAVFDGDYDKAIAISEVCAMEPCYQPPPPIVVQTKGKKTKPIKITNTNGIGFVEPESESLTIAESAAQADSFDKSLNVDLNLSKMSISKSESDSLTVKEKNSKKNKRKDSEGSTKEKTKASKTIVQKKVPKSQSESISKTTNLDSDSIISKLIESRLSEISNEVNFLRSISESKCVDKEKLKSELKKVGIGKGYQKKETLDAAKKNFKSGKGQLKQQWVSKSNSSCSSPQSESGSNVSSGEPILGWVPKRN